MKNDKNTDNIKKPNQGSKKESSLEIDNPLACDPETGICAPGELPDLSNIKQEKVVDPKYLGKEIIYVGDPMCSWCWGIAPALKELRDHYKTKGIKFSTVVGGLRPGGGDPWDDQMKEFLAHHWKQVNEASGQPFGYELFNKESFTYDTEPACRAVVTARSMVGEKELEFFAAVKEKFYVHNQDPKEEIFYKSICEDFEIDYNEFITKWNSEEMKYATTQEFHLNRGWGVTGFPAVLLKTEKELFALTKGYNTFENMSKTIEKIVDL